MNDINSWCDKNTKGCIKKILDQPLSEDCRLGLINALYFKGMWAEKFNKDQTREEDFTNYDGAKSKVKMMHQTETFLAYEGKDVDMAEFDYGNGRFCMDVILPHEGKKLDECLKEFSSSTFFEYVKESRERDVIVSMPRMEIEFNTSLIQPLIDMGMKNAFIRGLADFSGITDDGKLFVEAVESLVEIFLADFLNIVTSAGPEPTPLIFNMNRPFAFVIREKDSNTILFMGKVRNL